MHKGGAGARSLRTCRSSTRAKAGTTGDFAEALRFVDILMLEIRDHTEQEASKEVQS